MSSMFSKHGLGMLVGTLLSIASPQAAKAYQVDCAILLCLAGGWPASAECSHARAVFIRRITPWPIEPPLQIWRCPMSVSSLAPLQSSAPQTWLASAPQQSDLAQIILAQVTGGADIDISSFEFDFVRSIRVWDVRHYSHRERGRDDDCSERYSMNLGTYGAQGDFSWQRITPAAAPAWVIPSRRCSSSNSRRGVGVEWEDHEGNHGYEWVAY
ncbi:MAG: hypothetical protein L3J30_14895 [Marinosulfonomonas sp.]|nr:hypothetical protein [Marinosulfonomonas sp.]